MISVVICSINKIYLQALKQNIDANIGVEHECLIWDNTEARLGICEVYNKMAERSKFPYLCFVHEDVLIETPSWGKILVEVCENDTEIGLIGVAGGK